MLDNNLLLDLELELRVSVSGFQHASTKIRSHGHIGNRFLIDIINFIVEAFVIMLFPSLVSRIEYEAGLILLASQEIVGCSADNKKISF